MDQYVIQTHNLVKEYNKTPVVKEVNLNIKKGRIYGLLGRNGAGKTTIMKMLLNLVSTTRGSISILGELFDQKNKRFISKFGAMIESPGFYPHLSAVENLKIFGCLKGATKCEIQEALQKVGLPIADKKPYSKYSLGMKQRLGIANAILHDPDILVLDEPTNGLDPIGIAEIREYLITLSKTYGKTILISSHQLFEIEKLVDDIGIIHKGKLLNEMAYNDISSNSDIKITLTASPISKALELLKQLGIVECDIQDEKTIIFHSNHDTASLNSWLVRNGIKVYSLCTAQLDLEEYFMRITGGVGIA